MNSKDALYLDEMTKIVKEQIYIKGKDRQKFLLENKAIKIENGEEVVLANYPKLVYYLKGEEVSYDEGGNLLILKIKMENMERDKLGNGHHIEYYPRFYSFFHLADSNIGKVLLELSSNCKVCEGKS